MADNGLGPAYAELLFVPEAPKSAHWKHACGYGRLHICVRIPKKNKLLGVDVQALGYQKRACRIRFSGMGGRGAHNIGEWKLREVVFDRQPGVRIEFIGNHIHFDFTLVKSSEELRDALIRLRFSFPSLVIFSLHLSNASVYGRFVSMGLRQNTLDKLRNAVADRPFVIFIIMSRESQIVQDLVHGIGQVIDGIQKSPIEVEDDGAVTIEGRDNISP